MNAQMVRTQIWRQDRKGDQNPKGAGLPKQPGGQCVCVRGIVNTACVDSLGETPIIKGDSELNNESNRTKSILPKPHRRDLVKEMHAWA